MKEYVFYFSEKLNKEVNVKHLDEDFVNDFMYENKLFGEDIFNELLKELHKHQIA